MTAATSAAARKVVDAWIIAGPLPHKHWQAQERLQHDWPELAAAVEALVAAASAAAEPTTGEMTRLGVNQCSGGYGSGSLGAGDGPRHEPGA